MCVTLDSYLETLVQPIYGLFNLKVSDSNLIQNQVRVPEKEKHWKIRRSL